MSASFDDLISRVKECDKKVVSVAAAEDDAVLEAVNAAHQQGIADAILCGRRGQDPRDCRRAEH